MAQTGMERSLTVIIEKKIAGVIQPGYPVTYSGRNAFTVDGFVDAFPAIDIPTMASMPVLDYNERLEAFKLWVERKELGLNFAVHVIDGFEAYKENLTSCSID